MGGIIRYPIPNAPGGFDLHSRPTAGAAFSTPIFSQLVKFNPDKRDMSPDNIIGDLAEKWEISADGKQVTFFLRKNVKWHDGKPFSADDVVYSLQKMVDPKRSTIGGMFPSFNQAEAINTDAVRVTLKQPTPAFLMQLCSVYSIIEPKHLAGTDPKTSAFLVGTGPFKFKSYTAGVSGELVRNPDYFIKGYPYLDGIAIYIMGDRSAQMDALVSGRLDILCPYGGIYSEEHLQRVQSQMKTAVIEVARPPQTSFFMLNTTNEYLKDARVRKAIALLVDQKSLVIAGYGSENWLVPNRYIFSTTFGLPDAEIAKAFGWDQSWENRVIAAKKLMSDAGYASGFKLQLVNSKIAEYERVYTVLADVLKRNLNIECELVLRETAEAWSLRDKGQYSIWLQEIIASTGDPDDIWPSLGTGKLANYTKYSNPTVDQLFTQESTTIDIAKRKSLTQEIEKTVLGDVPLIPLRGSIMRVAWAPYVKGFVLLNAGYGPQLSFERVWLDK